jgi:hypothetical protein
MYPLLYPTKYTYKPVASRPALGMLTLAFHDELLKMMRIWTIPADQATVISPDLCNTE